MPTGSKRPTSELTREVGDLIRARISYKRLTQSAVAEATGISNSQLSKYLGGKRSPTIDELDDLCWVLGMDLSELVTKADRETDGRFLNQPDPLVHD